MKRGGHDYRKVYAAYHAATVRNGRPTVVLAKTVKGYGLGANFEARNATHQMKKLTVDDLKQFRTLMNIPISDGDIEKAPYDAPYYHPGADTRDPVHAAAAQGAGRVPAGAAQLTASADLPDDRTYAERRRAPASSSLRPPWPSSG